MRVATLKYCPKCKTDKTLELFNKHATGDIRGLLCTKCNALLGLALDSEDILERAKQYLKNSRVKYSTAINITLQK